MAAKRKLKLVPIKPECSAELIERLADLMKDAKSGELQSFAYAGECRDKSIVTGYTSTDDVGRMLGALSRLQYNMCGALDK